MELFDSHCHLNYDYTPKTIEQIIQEAQNQGVKTLMTVGTDIPTLGTLAQICEKFPNIYHTAGVHPHEVQSMTETDLVKIKQASEHPKCMAIGEIGLDYYYEHSDRESQKKWLSKQLELALKVHLPVVIHSRDAEEDLLAQLTPYAKKVAQIPSPGIIHCFSGSEEFALACVDLGFYISFSGMVTFKNADNLRQIAAKLPLERILIETDSPYLAPVPLRGKKCEPAMVRHTAEKLAEVRGITLEALAKATTKNAKAVFQI